MTPQPFCPLFLLRGTVTVVGAFCLLAGPGGAADKEHPGAALPLWKVSQEGAGDAEKESTLLQESPAEGVLDELRQAARLPGAAWLADRQNQPVIPWIPQVFIGLDNAYSGEGIRYLVVRLTLVNTGEAPVTLRRERIVLRADKETFFIGEYPDDFREIPLQVDREVLPQSRLKTPEVLRVGPGKAASFWCVFAGLRNVPEVPALTLRLEFEDAQHVQLDVGAQQNARLGLERRQIGPSRSLGVFTIHGHLNTVNAGRLAREMEVLAEAGTERVLVEWDSAAPPVDDLLLTWLLQGSVSSRRANSILSQLPALPAFRKLLLTGLPEGNSDASGRDEFSDRIFESPASAAASALEEVFARMNLPEVIKELRGGDPWSRQAALRTAGGRLGREALPLLSELAASSDSATREAALLAFGNQPDGEGHSILTEAARGGSQRHAEAALVSLLRADGKGNVEVILRLLEDRDLNVPPARVVTLLADHYRTEWSEYLVDSLSDDDPQVRIAGYQALQSVGHPGFVDLCMQGLGDRSQDVRDAAFQILVKRSDPASEEAALEYALDLLEEGTVNQHVIGLIRRTRDTRAAAPLQKLLEKESPFRVKLIELLARVGDDGMARRLVERMNEFSAQEQVAVLNLVLEIALPGRLEIARQAMDSELPAVRKTAMGILQQDAGEAAVEILAQALRGADDAEFEALCRTLGQIGTRAARDVLLQFRQRSVEEGREEGREQATKGLRILMAQSPGWSSVEQALYHWGAEDWDEAEKFFSLAIEIDADLPMAHSWRGNVYLKKEDYGSARRDFSQAMELDPYSVDAVTGLAIVLTIQGEFERGIELVTKTATRFPKDNIFAYNTACVYSRAAEHVGRRPPSGERDRLLETYRAQAIKSLKEAIQYGFDDFQWMQEDPDIVPLHELPEFKEILRLNRL